MNITAGLEDQNLEIYKFDGKVRATYSGKSVDYMQLPESIREIFQVELINDKKACQCLIGKMCITNADKMEETFVGCRYGAYNSIPDLEAAKTTPDIPVCNELETCPGYGIVCKAPEGPGGHLARKEFQVAILIAKGKLDKEIAEELGIQIPTLRTHIARVREKLHVNNRIEIALWFHNHGI